jgi:hypothetical protein
MSLLTALRRNPKRRLGALGALLVAGSIAVGSGANFTSASANPSNTLSAGTLSQVNSKAGSAILTAPAMRPGDSATGTVDIENSGSLSAVFRLSRSNIVDSDGANPMSAKLQLVVTDCGLWSGGTAPTCASGSQVYSGTIASMAQQTLGTFAASAKRRYQFVVTFPDAGTGGADDAYQGDSTTVQFDWTSAS